MTGFPDDVRDMVAARCGGRCEICGGAPMEQLHHRRPRGMGGSQRPETNTASNALGVCAGCHLLVESNRYHAGKRGWIVSQRNNPADVEVLIRGTYRLLDDAGDYA